MHTPGQDQYSAGEAIFSAVTGCFRSHVATRLPPLQEVSSQPKLGDGWIFCVFRVWCLYVVRSVQPHLGREECMTGTKAVCTPGLRYDVLFK